jgi:hypothetical protein
MAQILGSVLRAICRPTIGVLLLASGLLGACAGDSDAPRPMHVSARAAGGVLDLTVDNIPPSREITALVLIDAGGGETPARQREMITREEGGDSFSGPGVSVGATGGSSSGVNPFISLGYLFRGKEPQRRSRRLQASIPIPDPAAYAAGYRDWRIEVRYRDHLGATEQVRIPAPAP